MGTQKEIKMKSANVLKVGMREFRSHLPQYLLTSNPVAITRHGETIGYYIPTKHHAEKSELEELKQAAKNLEDLLIAHGLTEDELVADFRTLREGKSK